MANTIKLTQEDLKKMVQNIVKEQQSDIDEQSDILKPGPDKLELHLGLTDDGGYVLYKTNENGEQEVVQKFDK